MKTKDKNSHVKKIVGLAVLGSKGSDIHKLDKAKSELSGMSPAKRLILRARLMRMIKARKSKNQGAA